ncbi:MAG: ORF6N domain-containing protein [Deltaproteobacteria bacterium]|nr:ORF6N domain-containing protein [Deltaproteobacteria bacterium]
MDKEIQYAPQRAIESSIIEIRGSKVILDTDLAAIYGVQTFRFNEAVKRNRDRFPSDFMFQLTKEEVTSLTSQNAMSKRGRGGRRTLPYAFTEHGAVMAANILKSPRAVQMSVFVVRAFVKMREMLIGQRDLAKKLADLEERLTERLDIHETAIVEVLRQVMTLLTPTKKPPIKPKKKIGFEVKESKGRYGKKTRKKQA